MEKLSHEEKNKALFISLIQQYQMQTWISLGKLKNPATDKFERDLKIAKLHIDLLEMLQEKTRGNLSEEEEKLLEQTLVNLRLNYVDEYEKEKKAQQGATEKTKEKTTTEQAENSSAEKTQTNK